MDTPLIVEKEAIAALLLYRSYGNIGQLKSDIRLICAKGFLNYKIHQKPVIDIDLNILPESITSDYYEEKENSKHNISFIQDKNHIFYPKGENTT